MKNIRFDFNNMMSDNVGPSHGVTARELFAVSGKAREAARHLLDLAKLGSARASLGLEWMQLPNQKRRAIAAIQSLGNEIAKSYDNVISLGIGGSYLGLKAAQDALCRPYYNEFKNVRKGRPRIYFEGNNLDPETLSVLLRNLDPLRTCVIVISKSGETTETKAAFEIVRCWLMNKAGKRYGRQIIAITDPSSGSLRREVESEQKNDHLSFRSLPLLKGVGGRFSELNMGLLHLAIIGIDIKEVLKGARAMAVRCSAVSLKKNPALLYAALHAVLYMKKGKRIAVMMPFSEGLKSTADWYTQLLAESLGKKYARKVKPGEGGTEVWLQDRRKVVNVGRTPLSCRGTNDLHSIQQNNIEGENDKTVTFIRVDRFREELVISGTKDFLAGKRYLNLINLAEEATEWALVRESRPNCTIRLSEVTPSIWGGLIFFFEMATAFEGELLGVNAFDQPGVESYKNYLYYKVKKPGLSAAIASEINSHPLVKNAGYIL